MEVSGKLGLSTIRFALRE